MHPPLCKTSLLSAPKAISKLVYSLTPTNLRGPLTSHADRIYICIVICQLFASNLHKCKTSKKFPKRAKNFLATSVKSSVKKKILKIFKKPLDKLLNLWYNYYRKKQERSTTMLKKLINYFELNKPYRFDITAPIYAICAFGIMFGFNMNILFFIGSAISTATCWQAKRLNLVVLNASLFLLNLYNIVMMFV